MTNVSGVAPIIVREYGSNCWVSPTTFAKLRDVEGDVGTYMMQILLHGKIAPGEDVHVDEAFYETGLILVSKKHPATGLLYSEDALAKVIRHEQIHAERWHASKWSALNYGNWWLPTVVEEYHAYRGGHEYGRLRALKCGCLTHLGKALPFFSIWFGAIE